MGQANLKWVMIPHCSPARASYRYIALYSSSPIITPAADVTPFPQWWLFRIAFARPNARMCRSRICVRVTILLRKRAEAYLPKSFSADIQNNITVKDRRGLTSRKVYENCFVGKEAVSWLLNSKSVSLSRSEAVSLMNSLMDNKYIEHPAKNGYFLGNL